MFGVEKVCQRILESPALANKLIIGGLLSFVPVVNLLSLGYLYRYGRQVRRHHELTLPAWGDWSGLLIDGLRFFILLVPTAFLPLWVGAALTSALQWLFRALGLDLLVYSVALVPVAVILTVVPVVALAALHQYQRREVWEDLRDWATIARRGRQALPALIVPCLAFTGLMVVGAGVYGFAFFLGFATLMAYTTGVFLLLEENEH